MRGSGTWGRRVAKCDLQHQLSCFSDCGPRFLSPHGIARPLVVEFTICVPRTVCRFFVAASCSQRIREVVRCVFETQVLCGVSCFWAPCKNGLQMCAEVVQFGGQASSRTLEAGHAAINILEFGPFNIQLNYSIYVCSFFRLRSLRTRLWPPHPLWRTLCCGPTHALPSLWDLDPATGFSV